MSILDASGNGDISREQALYHELERAFPVYNMLKRRRLSALKSRDIGGDKTFCEIHDTLLRDLIAHLGSFVFYGVAAAIPVLVDDLWLDTIFIDSRDLSFDPRTGDPFWTHPVNGVPTKEPLDLNTTCMLYTESPLCLAIAQMYARYNVVLDKYCDYMERFGIPTVSVVMPPTGDKNKYQESANAAQEGENVVWPNQTTVQFAPVDKSTAPFIEFLNYVDAEIVKLCTGGILTTLTAATGMGSGVSDSHSNTWAEVTMDDATDVGREISRVFSKKFEIDKDIAVDSGTAIQQVVDLTQAGFEVDMKEASEASGWTLKKKV